MNEDSDPQWFAPRLGPQSGVFFSSGHGASMFSETGSKQHNGYIYIYIYLYTYTYIYIYTHIWRLDFIRFWGDYGIQQETTRHKYNQHMICVGGLVSDWGMSLSLTDESHAMENHRV